MTENVTEPTTAAGRTLVRWLTTGNNPPRSAEHIALVIEAEARAAALDEASAAVEARLADDTLCDATDGEHHTPEYIDAILAAIDALREGER